MQAGLGIIVRRSVQEVWRWVADPRNLPTWLNGLSDVQPAAAGPMRTGTAMTATYTEDNRRHTIALHVVEALPPHRLVLRWSHSPYPLTTTLEMEEVGEAGTQAFETRDFAPRTGLLTPAVGPFIRARMRLRMRKGLTALSDAIEALPLR